MPTLPDDFSPQKQQGENLCWIAIAASVADFYSAAPGGTRQCDLAQHLVASVPAGTQCCAMIGTPPNVPSECDKAGLVSDALKRVGHFAGQSTLLASYDDIERGISSDQPIALALAYEDGTNHVVAIVDAYLDRGGQVLVIQDPADPSEIYYDYGSLDLGGQQNIDWRWTFFTSL